MAQYGQIGLEKTIDLAVGLYCTGVCTLQVNYAPSCQPSSTVCTQIRTGKVG